jgi:hypothetical protein
MDFIRLIENELSHSFRQDKPQDHHLESMKNKSVLPKLMEKYLKVALFEGV